MITHHKGLKLIPDPRNSATVLDVTGTIAATVTGDIAQTGDFALTGDLACTTLGVTSSATLPAIKVASAANSICGLRTIAAASAGVGVVATTKALSSSRIFLSPAAPTANYRNANAFVSTVASGSSFTIRLGRTQTAGTNATASGRVSWLIVNK